MSRTLENKLNLILLMLVLATSISAVISNFSLAFAKNNGINFEITECPVQRTSTTEKSGPCPDMGAESSVNSVTDNKIVEPESKVDKSSDNTRVHSAPPTGFGIIDPFGSTTK